MVGWSLLSSPIAGARQWIGTELRSTGTQRSAVTLAGNVGRLALGFAASIVIARWLGPAAYGLVVLIDRRWGGFLREAAPSGAPGHELAVGFWTWMERSRARRIARIEDATYGTIEVIEAS